MEFLYTLGQKFNFLPKNAILMKTSQINTLNFRAKNKAENIKIFEFSRKNPYFYF